MPLSNPETTFVIPAIARYGETLRAKLIPFMAHVAAGMNEDAGDDSLIEVQVPDKSAQVSFPSGRPLSPRWRVVKLGGDWINRTDAAELYDAYIERVTDVVSKCMDFEDFFAER